MKVRKSIRDGAKCKMKGGGEYMQETKRINQEKPQQRHIDGDRQGLIRCFSHLKSENLPRSFLISPKPVMLD